MKYRFEMLIFLPSGFTAQYVETLWRNILEAPDSPRHEKVLLGLHGVGRFTKNAKEGAFKDRETVAFLEGATEIAGSDLYDFLHRFAETLVRDAGATTDLDCQIRFGDSGEIFEDPVKVSVPA